MSENDAEGLSKPHWFVLKDERSTRERYFIQFPARKRASEPWCVFRGDLNKPVRRYKSLPEAMYRARIAANHRVGGTVCLAQAASGKPRQCCLKQRATMEDDPTNRFLYEALVELGDAAPCVCLKVRHGECDDNDELPLNWLSLIEDHIKERDAWIASQRRRFLGG